MSALYRRVLDGDVPEDAVVEFKREWIDERKAARRLAAQANAARGEPVLWIVGIDEKNGSITNPPKANRSHQRLNF